MDVIMSFFQFHYSSIFFFFSILDTVSEILIVVNGYAMCLFKCLVRYHE